MENVKRFTGKVSWYTVYGLIFCHAYTCMFSSISPVYKRMHAISKMHLTVNV